MKQNPFFKESKMSGHGLDIDISIRKINPSCEHRMYEGPGDEYTGSITVRLTDKKKFKPKTGYSGWGSGESQLLYRLKKLLIDSGHDVIKKRMQDDGHMYGDQRLQYIRSRKTKGTWFRVYDTDYAVRDSAAELVKDGETWFRFEGFVE